MADLDLLRTATISDDGVYRYRLGRRWDDRSPVLFVMLNPSTADADIDDPTIRRCVGFARSWGWGGIEVVNRFALRATNPGELMTADDPVGPHNDEHVRQALRESIFTVVAWGAHPLAADPWPLLDDAQAAGPVRCLGKTKVGAPRHPLYMAASTPLELWP